MIRVHIDEVVVHGSFGCREEELRAMIVEALRQGADTEHKSGRGDRALARRIARAVREAIDGR